VYLELGQVNEALPRLRRALDIHRRTLGEAHVDTVPLWPVRAARPRARELAAAAQVALAGSSGADARLRARIASWCDRHSR
jgi:hypothetical protein